MPIHHIKKHKKKSITVALIAVAVLGYLLFIRQPSETQTLTAVRGEFLQQVSVSGKVMASENVDLSFENPGIVRGVYVKVGDAVFAGKLLASQDTAELYAKAAQMQAGIDLQKAKLAQLLAGSAPADIKVKEDGLAAASEDLEATYASALSDLTGAYNHIYSAYNVVVSIKNTYFAQLDQAGAKMEQIKYEVANSLAKADSSLNSGRAGTANMDAALESIIAELKSVYANVKKIRDLTEEGAYYFSVSNADKTSLDTQRANINTALTSVLSAKQDIISDKAAVVQAENALAVIKATPRQTDTAIYEAQIKQAEASLQEVYAQIRTKQVIAPIAGIVTVVNAKVGSIAGSDLAISLISSGKFQIESYVPEMYVAQVKVGNDANVTLDSFGTDKIFRAKVVSIEPSQTQKDGVATYKTILQFVDRAEVKDGMSANVVIITNKKENVISVPQGLVKMKDGRKYVEIKNGDTVESREVVTGDISSSGQVEIVVGLNEGDVLPIK